MDVSIMSLAMTYMAYLTENHPEGFTGTIRTRNASELLPSYDFIVVGAGSAGSALAGRLSENKSWKVLLVEAGIQETEYSRTPGINNVVASSRYTWNYTTTPQPATCKELNGVCPYPRGRALGGSGAVNGMIYARGYKSDYDRWGEDNPGWDFKHVHKYFLKSEGNRNLHRKNHGRHGPLTVSYPPYHTEIRDSILQAAQEIGFKHKECQDYEFDCVEYTESTIRDGRRCSASTAYLESFSQIRENLHIITEATVTKVITKDHTATSVRFEWNGKIYNINANKEIILSAGTFDSPKLLMLSGIGPKKHLESLGIDVVEDLPVGENMQDHYVTTLPVKVSRGVPTIPDLECSMEEYLHHQTGPLSSGGFEIMGYSSLGISKRPVFQYYIATVSDNEDKVFRIQSTLMRPFTRGTIRLKSANPHEQQLIDPNDYGDQRDYDLTLAGMKEAVKLVKTKTMQSYNATLLPVVGCTPTEPIDDFLKCVMNSFTVNGHPVGTVKMSPKHKGGVVNNLLQVYGVKNLRVVDASIAPYAVSMNANAMAVMVGEKGADLIKEFHLLH